MLTPSWLLIGARRPGAIFWRLMTLSERLLRKFYQAERMLFDHSLILHLAEAGVDHLAEA
jgi:hypothetical protein